MWKRHFNVVNKRVDFHRGCGNRCGNLSFIVENEDQIGVFHISTTPIRKVPVEMWKTFT